jgi:hypothetical protein
LILDTQEAPEKEVRRVAERYQSMKHSGELESRLSKLQKKQKKATTTNGPHPHHQAEGYGQKPIAASRQVYNPPYRGQQEGSYYAGTQSRNEQYPYPRKEYRQSYQGNKKKSFYQQSNS